MGRRNRWDRGDYYGYSRFAPYVPVAQRQAQAKRYAKALEKREGRKLAPVALAGRNIADTFWGQAWCENLEAYSDFANRLPRGRTYVRNGSVIDLQIAAGKITALVSGSEVYDLSIKIERLPSKTWAAICGDCSSSITSLVDLLQGRFERGVMDRLTRLDNGLFPQPHEMKLKCSCPDYAGLCKHLAAVLYGVGARLDQSPELLFTLRSVDHLELLAEAVSSENLDQALSGDATDALQGGDLSELFGIELDSTAKTRAPRQPAAKAKRGAMPKIKTAAAVVVQKPARKTKVGAAARAAAKQSKSAAERLAASAKPATARRTKSAVKQVAGRAGAGKAQPTNAAKPTSRRRRSTGVAPAQNGRQAPQPAAARKSLPRKSAVSKGARSRRVDQAVDTPRAAGATVLVDKQPTGRGRRPRLATPTAD